MTTHPNMLCERDAAGLNVQIAWLPIMQMGILQCSVEEKTFATSVPSEKLLDAFNHPMLYLAPAHIEALGIR